MNKLEFVAHVAALAQEGVPTKVRKVMKAGPLCVNVVGEPGCVTALGVTYQVGDSDPRPVTIVSWVAQGVAQFQMVCAVDLLVGRVPTGASSVEAAVASMPLPEGLRDPDSFREKVLASVGVLEVPDDTVQCATAACSHVISLAHHLEQAGFVSDILQELEALWLHWIPAMGSQGAVLRDWRDPKEHLFKLPVLLMGDRGAGKTFFSRGLADEVGAELLEMGFHAETRASAMLGKMVLNGQGTFAWVDGPVSRAFRLAKRGKRVVLLLDELLRAPQEQLSALLTAFSPTQRGTLKLTTGRVVAYDEDEVGIEEVIEAPVQNIAIVATTNVGAEYAVGDLDPALQERFFVVKMDTNEATLKRVLEAICDEKRFERSLAKRLVSFWKGMNALVLNGALSRAPTLRVLSRALQRVATAEEIESSVLAETLQWAELDVDGQVVPEHVKAIESAWKAAT